jgi:hypothetical protein
MRNPLAATVFCCVFATVVAGCGGSHARPYTIDGVPDNDSFHPSWAPDGREFVYARDYQLYVYDLSSRAYLM